MYNEWELLVAAEDIEQGDEIIVENDDGESERMIFVKTKGSKVLILRDKNDDLIQFNAHTLEELNGYRVVVGKVE